MEQRELKETIQAVEDSLGLLEDVDCNGEILLARGHLNIGLGQLLSSSVIQKNLDMTIKQAKKDIARSVNWPIEAMKEEDGG